METRLVLIGLGVVAVELDAGTNTMDPPSTISEFDEMLRDLEVSLTNDMIGCSN